MPTIDTRAEAFERHRRDLRAYAVRMVARPDVADDIVQDAASACFAQTPLRRLRRKSVRGCSKS